MEINRFKEIIRYSSANREHMESKVRDFYTRADIGYNREVLNLMQIARSLFRQKGYIIVELPFADKEIGALCYKGDAYGYTFLNTSLPRVNVNFALCHEIYHVFYQETEFEKRVDLYINEHYYEHETELAANLFAGMLLMPEQSFVAMFSRFRNEAPGGTGPVTVIAKLMSYFGVPYMAALIRCYELDLLESGDVLETLLGVNVDQIRDEFARLWLDESMLNASQKDDYARFERYIAYWGKLSQAEGYLNDRTVNKALQNMRTLYHRIKGE